MVSRYTNAVQQLNHMLLKKITHYIIVNTIHKYVIIITHYILKKISITITKKCIFIPMMSYVSDIINQIQYIYTQIKLKSNVQSLKLIYNEIKWGHEQVMRLVTNHTATRNNSSPIQSLISRRYEAHCHCACHPET